MKKLLILSLILVFVVPSLIMGTACKEETGSVEEDVEGEIEEPVEEVTLVIVDDGLGTAKENIMNNAINEYTKKFPHVTVNYQPWDHETLMTEGMLALFAEGATPPDVFWIRQGYWVNSFVQAGRIMDLTSYTNELTIDGNMRWGDYFHESITLNPNTGKIDGIPLSTSISTFWWYNVAIFEDLGLSEPETWSDFIDILDTVKDSGITPIATGSRYWGNLFNEITVWLQRKIGAEKLNNVFLQQNDARWDDPDIIAVFEILDEWVQKGYFVESLPANECPDYEPIFAAGDTAIIQDGGWLAGFLADIEPEEFQNVFPKGVDFFITPAIPNGVGDPSGLVQSVETLAVSSETEHPREAVDFLKTLTQAEYGISLVESGFICPWEGIAGLATDLELDEWTIKQVQVGSNAKDSFVAADVAFGDENAELFNEAVNWVVLQEKTPEEAMNDLQKLFEELQSGDE